MIKILKAGRRQPEKHYRGTCSGCGCEIECDADSLSPVASVASDGSEYASCPTPRCGQFVTVRPIPVDPERFPDPRRTATF